jgi:hypothetical protein
MPEELGRIERPAADEYQQGRKLYYVPLVFSAPDLPLEFVVKFGRYWEQVGEQIAHLENRLGPVNRVYHELIIAGGDEGLKELKQVSENSYNLIQPKVEKGATLEIIEDAAILAELMDWSRCLAGGLESPTVMSKVYEFYSAANKHRGEINAKRINESLKPNESGILIMAEGHHLQLADDIRMFYVAPPALDEIKRWMRDYEAKLKQQAKEQQTKEPEGAMPETEKSDYTSGI